MSVPVDGSYDVILVSGSELLLGRVTALRLMSQYKHLRLAVLEDPRQTTAIREPRVILTDQKISMDLLEKMNLLKPTPGGPSLVIESTVLDIPEGAQTHTKIENILGSEELELLAAALKTRLESEFGVSFVPCRVLSVDRTCKLKGAVIQALFYGAEERLIRLSCCEYMMLCNAKYAASIDCRPPLSIEDSMRLETAPAAAPAMRLCLTFSPLPVPWTSAELANFTAIYSSNPCVRSLRHRYKDSIHYLDVIVAGAEGLASLQRKRTCEERKDYIVNELFFLMENLVGPSKKANKSESPCEFVRLRAGEPWPSPADAGDSDWDYCDQTPIPLTTEDLSRNLKDYKESLCCLEAPILASHLVPLDGADIASPEPISRGVVLSLEKLLRAAEAMSNELLSDELTSCIEKERKLKKQELSPILGAVVLIVFLVGLVCILLALYQAIMAYFGQPVSLHDIISDSDTPQIISTCDASQNAMKYML